MQLPLVLCHLPLHLFQPFPSWTLFPPLTPGITSSWLFSPPRSAFCPAVPSGSLPQTPAPTTSFHSDHPLRLDESGHILLSPRIASLFVASDIFEFHPPWLLICPLVLRPFWPHSLLIMPCFKPLSPPLDVTATATSWMLPGLPVSPFAISRVMSPTVPRPSPHPRLAQHARPPGPVPAFP